MFALRNKKTHQIVDYEWVCYYNTGSTDMILCHDGEEPFVTKRRETLEEIIEEYNTNVNAENGPYGDGLRVELPDAYETGNMDSYEIVELVVK
ncbi:hypothetical protein [Escherichia phage vB_EcoM_JNE01]|nr:hypothetical protein [Escherichia phage vB_EcoM_JNE01]